MDIKSYSREKILSGLNKAGKTSPENAVKILFSPTRITDDNFEQVCEVFASIRDHNYETVIVLEGCDHELEKKIPMPSNDIFKTHLGEVQVNATLRDEFCDEEDDFYIDDSAFNEDLSLFQQLPMLQSTVREPSVVSMQVYDQERMSIIRELAFVLSEVLYNRNVLIIICTEMSNTQKESFNKIMQYYSNSDDSNLKNTVNSDSIDISGRSALMTGLMIAQKWGLNVHFVDDEFTKKPGTSLISGYAYLKSN